LATVGDFVDQAGLRPLTREPAERSQFKSVTGVLEYQPAGPLPPTAGAVVYIRSASWLSVPDPAALAAQFHSHGVVAVVIDNDDRGLPAEFVTACLRDGVPVFLLPKDVAFAQVASGSAEQHTSRHRSGELDAIRESIDDFADSSGACAWLVMTGCAVSGSRSADTDLLLRILTRDKTDLGQIAATSAAVHAELSDTGAVLALTNPDRARLNRAAIEKLAQALATEVRSIHVKRSARRQSESALISQLIDARIDSDALGPWAQSLGLEPGRRIRAVAATPSNGSCPEGTVVAALQDLALCTGTTAVCGAHKGNAYALISLPDAADVPHETAVFDAHLDVLTHVFAARFSATLSTGASSFLLHTGDDLVRGLVYARHLATRNAKSALSQHHTIPLPLPMAATILAATPEVLHTLDRTLLQPVINYDEEKGSHYLATLRTFLALDGQPAATATELGIHINTLRYRLSRIERLTGRGLHSMADRVDFYLALCLRESGLTD
jgi:sugar diacid utilization regulator